MTQILISEDAFEDLNEGFFYETQDYGLGDYFTSCLRADVEGLRITAGIHKQIEGYYRLLSRIFPYCIFSTVEGNTATIWAVVDLRRDPEWILEKLKK